jgi:hypothetical protein
MDIDAKHKALYALYAEYQRDIPDMTRVTHGKLNMEKDVFNVALLKLQNEGFIDGLVIPNISQQQGIVPIRVLRERSMPTRYGIEYVENKLEIDKALTTAEKLRALRDKCGRFGWDVLQSAAAQILANMMSGG